MNNIIDFAAGKLEDPILMDWALDRYSETKNGDPRRREAMDRAWFNDLVLRPWLDTDDFETLTRLFVHLPEERFASLGQAIGERWGSWSGSLASHSAPVLARYKPDIARKCFAEPGGGDHRYIEPVLGIIRSLPVLPHEFAARSGLRRSNPLLKIVGQQKVIALALFGFHQQAKIIRQLK